jgi:hypothetical protein
MDGFWGAVGGLMGGGVGAGNYLSGFGWCLEGIRSGLQYLLGFWYLSYFCHDAAALVCGAPAIETITNHTPCLHLPGA